MICNPAIAKITYIVDDATMEEKTENILFQADTWTDAMRSIEKLYGKDLLNVQVVMLEESPVLLSDETFDQLANFQEILL